MSNVTINIKQGIAIITIDDGKANAFRLFSVGRLKLCNG
jgi:hypothetical protein